MERNLTAELESARVTTDDLFALLAPEALYERPIPERHRLIFYLGHLEAFDWNLIARTTLDVRRDEWVDWGTPMEHLASWWPLRHEPFVLLVRQGNV